LKRIKNRHLFNGDSCFLFAYSKIWQPEGGKFSVKTIHRFLDKLADAGIDTLLMNPNTDVAWYPSKVWPTSIDGYSRGDRDFFRSDGLADALGVDSNSLIDDAILMYDGAYDLRESGIDWLAEVCSGCRQRGIAPWLSVRMNDTHRAANPDDWSNSPFQGRADAKQKNTFIFPHQNALGLPVGLNYGLPDVRSHMLTLIRELIEDYDFEGMELDWLRDPICCEPPATETDIAELTEWHSEIRELVRKKEKRIGKPYALGIRCPANIDLIRNIGLDVIGMARSGVIDFVSPSNYMQTSWNICYSSLKRRLGPDITVYGVIEYLFNWLPVYSPELELSDSRTNPDRVELLRGNAAGKLAAGADGIEYFNFFEADTLSNGLSNYSHIKDIDNLDALRGQEKLYGLGYMFGSWVRPLFETVDHFPANLEPGALKSVRLPMCAEPPESDLEVTVQVIVEKRDRPDMIGVSLNGSWPQWESEEIDDLLFSAGSQDKYAPEKHLLTKHSPKHTAYNFRFETQNILEGWNELVILNGNLDRCHGGNASNNYSAMVMFAPYDADRDYSEEERAEHSVVVAGVEVGIRKTKRGHT